MGALEEIQAAIETLERLKAESAPGPWEWVGSFTNNELALNGDARFVITAGGIYTKGFLYVSPIDAELIVTLHRTIDAQLAILAEAKRVNVQWFTVEYEHEFDHAGPTSKSYLAALELARAINGGT